MLGYLNVEISLSWDTSVLGYPCWDISALGYLYWDISTGISILGYPCWDIHTGISLLGYPCQDEGSPGRPSPVGSPGGRSECSARFLRDESLSQYPRGCAGFNPCSHVPVVPLGAAGSRAAPAVLGTL